MKTRFLNSIFILVIITAAIARSVAATAAQNPQPPNGAATFKITTVTGVVGAKSNGNGEGLRLNFRGASLDEVLDYLSKAAGFTIIKNANVDGQLDVWSYQPLNKDEAVDLLNTVLNEKGYAAVRNDRVLTIVTREDAKKRNIPVKKGNEPAAIPKTDEMVTQIIPVRFANAVKLIDNLSPLLESYATMTADESSNAIVLTDTQANIRRIAEIIRALDSSISGVSSIKVFPLKFADAADLAKVVNDLFQNDQGSTSSNNRNRQQRGGGRFQMMFGGPPGMQQQNPEGGDSEARQAAYRITAAADEQTNSLIVSAPEEVMPTIEHLVEQVDAAKEELTEIRVFRLQNADAEEMAQLITDLFQDQTTSSQNQQRGIFGGRRFAFPGGPGGPGGPFGNQQNQDQSERKIAQETVTAVADIRTKSVVVSAAKDLMDQIEKMVKELDANPSKTQKVFIYSIKNADVDYVADVLSSMFEEQTLGTSRSSSSSRTSATGRSSTTSRNTSSSSNSNRNSSSSGFGSGSSGFGSSR